MGFFVLETQSSTLNLALRSPKKKPMAKLEAPRYHHAMEPLLCLHFTQNQIKWNLLTFAIRPYLSTFCSVSSKDLDTLWEFRNQLLRIRTQDLQKKRSLGVGLNFIEIQKKFVHTYITM